ncbi:Counting factor 60 [Wickerhamomyces ciferrii]|uniref:Counting factor 60 n=1 Tax=Wickerhamomyces ciferrii (strain ATCC 14091 / BCRC 22168 / CBS 111 / JCM 3599 / NBRC 0793 / NRRL Y-1031 F-60-10) TaxID=1206466 RepID=K0KHK8_WICCF|nr:Counting factor 60 [Wickerhamomyces ciferrii]CCH44695.1 Counting factor 60 [Wickerhamomyces ciferrii]
MLLTSVTSLFALASIVHGQDHLEIVTAPQFLEQPLSGFHHGSQSPLGVSEHYNYCNMPRTNKDTYTKVNSDYELIYVELIHRHHKRTAYASNLLPGDIKEDYMKYPQITTGGKIDSFNHGKDLYGVYHDVLGFLPDEYDSSKVEYRVTNNNITTQVFNSLIKGMYPSYNITPELREDDNLEPNLKCKQGDDLKTAIRSTPTWYQETNLTIYKELGDQDGVNAKDQPSFFNSIDHFFDNLSSKTCAGDAINVTESQFNTVMKLGHWEYDYTFRQSPNATAYGAYKFGNFTLELASHFQSAIDGESPVIYKHNIAHDGSISALTALIKDFTQIKLFQWPGMGSEYVFELYKKNDDHYLRILYAGRELTFTSVDEFFGYLDNIKVSDYSTQCSA